MTGNPKKILIHLGGGIGDVIMATPAITALAERGHSVDVLIEADFPNIKELFRSWAQSIRVTNQRVDFEGQTYDFYVIGWMVKIPMPVDKSKTVILTAEYNIELFKNYLSQVDLNLHTAKAIDSSINLNQETYCGHSKRKFPDISSKTVVLCCGCRSLYTIKRWDKFAALAERFQDVAVIGTQEDLDVSFSYSYPGWISRYFGKYLRYKGKFKKVADLMGKKHLQTPQFGSHVKNFIGKLSLADTAALVSQAGLFIGNDGGLSHVAAAVGTPTVVIFGPSSLEKVRVRRKNILYISKNLDCQPCQLGGKYPEAWKYWYIGCPIDMKCLKDISVDEVYQKALTFVNEQK